MTPSLPARPSTFWGPVLGTETPGHLENDHEVLVIGAGITGMTTALLLARKGYDVAVVDAARPGSGTTAKSSAKATLLHATVCSAIRQQHGQDAVDQYVAANARGQRLVQEIVKETGLVDMQTRDSWTYATTDEGARKVRAEHEALVTAGLPAELATPHELPFGTRVAVRLAEQLQINPAQYLSALYGELSALNVPVVWPYRVAVIDSYGDHLHATTAQGLTTRAKWMVIATLLPFPLRTMAFANTTPSRSYVVSARVTSPLPRGMYISAESPAHSLRTAFSESGEELLLAGGYSHEVGHANPASRHLDRLAQWTDETFGVREFVHRWSAQDYASVHVLPQVGPAPLGPRGLLIATGFGKWGITNGSAAGELIAGHIAGQRPTWGELFLPRPAAWPKVASRNARVGFTLAKGWLVEPFTARDVKPGWPAPRAVSEVDGQRRECSAVCTHLGGIVRWNDAESSWDCPLHGSRFGPEGHVLEGPAVDALDGQHAQRVWSREAPEADRGR